MTASDRAEPGRRLPRTIWVQSATWLLSLACLLLAVWGGVHYLHGWRLQRVANARGITLTVEARVTPALRAWFGEELVRPLDRIVGVRRVSPTAEDLPLLNGLPYLRSLSLTADAPHDLPELGMIDWSGMRRLESLALRSPSLNLSVVEFESLVELKRLSLTSAHFVGVEDLKLPASLQNVRVDGEFEPAIMRSIAELPGLQDVYLRLNTDQPLPAGWGSVLRPLRARSLHLSAHATPGNPQSFSGAVSADQIDWGGLAQVEGLHSLHVNVADLGPAELTHLAEYSRVHSLSLHVVGWRAEPSAPISTFRRLETLSLEISGGEIDLRLLSQIHPLKRLSLGLRETALSGECLRHLSKLRSLESLKLSAPIDQSALEELTRFPALKEIWISSHDLNPAVLARMTNLESLTLRVPKDSTGRDQLLPLARLPRLKRLELGSVIDPSGIAALAAFPALEELVLSWTSVTAEQLQALRGSPRLRRLEILRTPAAGVVTPEWRDAYLPGVEIISHDSLRR